MEIRTRVSPEEVKEAIELSRPRNFWFKFLLSNWYASLIGLLVIAADGNSLIHGQSVKWGPSAGLLVFVVVALWYSWYSWNGKVSKVLQTASSRIQCLALESDGAKILTETGASSFLPWSSYKTWSEGMKIFLLQGKDGMTILPIDDGSRETLRNLLQSKIAGSR